MCLNKKPYKNGDSIHVILDMLQWRTVINTAKA